MTTANLFSAFDARIMARAFKLAEQGIYSTTPNPHVGCVIVDLNQQIIGEGFHKKAGTPHAEVHALNQAGVLAKGATAYVTLEPCAHTNRTGPCALALVRAGVAEVVIACVDPNPEVAGKGIAILEQAGIKVRVGLMQQIGDALNAHFFFRMQHNRPFVTVKLAASIDGRTALADGQSKWITGPLARHDVQGHRAKACAILTGADTVIADNPHMNVRVDELPSSMAEKFAWREQQPLRVVTDSQNRLVAKQFQMFNDLQPCLVYNLAPNEALINADKQNAYVKQQQIPAKIVHDTGAAKLDLQLLMRDLAQKQINHVWVEAGAALTGALFDNKLVDELIVYQAPMLLGNTARPLTDYTSPTALNDALKGHVTEVKKLGLDTKTRIRFA